MTDWRYFATRLHGDGTETLLADDLPLAGVEIESALSGPGGLTATISPELARLKGDDGLPVLTAWGTALYAEKDRQIRGGGILTEPEVDGPVLSLSAVGFSDYARNMPYTGTYSKIQVDPLDVVRHIWSHLQGQDHGDLGLVVAGTKSKVRIGTEEKEVEFTTGAGEEVSFESGPYKLSWWSTDDLAKEIDDLAEATPFEYRVRHYWEGDEIRHELELGYPSLGRRLTEPRFAVGENIVVEPRVSFGTDDYADEVLVLGAGEGRSMIRGSWAQRTGRLRRVAVIDAKDLRKKAEATRLAEREVRLRTGEPEIAESITVWDHPNAPIGTYDPGDEILVHTGEGWTGSARAWYRILSVTIDPENSTASLSLVRAEKVR